MMRLSDGISEAFRLHAHQWHRWSLLSREVMRLGSHYMVLHRSKNN